MPSGFGPRPHLSTRLSDQVLLVHSFPASLPFLVAMGNCFSAKGKVLCSSLHPRASASSGDMLEDYLSHGLPHQWVRAHCTTASARMRLRLSQQLFALEPAPAGKMEKITFGDNLPGYVAGAAGAPGVVCVQVTAGGRRSGKRAATARATLDRRRRRPARVRE